MCSQNPLFLVPHEDLDLRRFILAFSSKIRSLSSITSFTQPAVNCSENKLTHRTCRATAPSARSLFVNRSVGNSCSAARDRHQQLGHFIYSKREKRGALGGQSKGKEDSIRKTERGIFKVRRVGTRAKEGEWVVGV